MRVPSRAVGTHVRISDCTSQKRDVDQRGEQRLRGDRVIEVLPFCQGLLDRAE